MLDLTTRYLGMDLRTPLVASASPLSQEIANIRKLEDAGAAAVVSAFPQLANISVIGPCFTFFSPAI